MMLVLNLPLLLVCFNLLCYKEEDCVGVLVGDACSKPPIIISVFQPFFCYREEDCVGG